MHVQYAQMYLANALTLWGHLHTHTQNVYICFEHHILKYETHFKTQDSLTSMIGPRSLPRTLLIRFTRQALLTPPVVSSHLGEEPDHHLDSDAYPPAPPPLSSWIHLTAAALSGTRAPSPSFLRAHRSK